MSKNRVRHWTRTTQPFEKPAEVIEKFEPEPTSLDAVRKEHSQGKPAAPISKNKGVFKSQVRVVEYNDKWMKVMQAIIKESTWGWIPYQDRYGNDLQVGFEIGPTGVLYVCFGRFMRPLGDKSMTVTVLGEKMPEDKEYPLVEMDIVQAYMKDERFRVYAVLSLEIRPGWIEDLPKYVVTGRNDPLTLFRGLYIGDQFFTPKKLASAIIRK